MDSQYHVDLEKFGLGEFKRILETDRLLPNERDLGEKISERFAILEAMEITTLQDLADRLSTSPGWHAILHPARTRRRRLLVRAG